MNPYYEKKNRYVLLDNKNAEYRNYSYLGPEDFVFNGKPYPDFGDQISDIDKIYTKSKLEVRTTLLNALDYGLRPKLDSSSAYYSESAKSFVVRFNPCDVQTDDGIFELLTILSEIQTMMRFTRPIYYSPLDSIQKIFEDFTLAKNDLRNDLRRSVRS